MADIKKNKLNEEDTEKVSGGGIDIKYLRELTANKDMTEEEKQNEIKRVSQNQ